MKLVNKTVALLLSIILIVSLMPANIFATGDATNLIYEISATDVAEGETFTLEISTKAMTVSTFGFYVSFDTSKLEVLSVTTEKLVYTEWVENEDGDEEPVESKKEATEKTSRAKANESGNIAAYWVQTEEQEFNATSAVLKVTFIALSSGNTDIAITERSSGENGFDNESNPFKETVTINAADWISSATLVTDVNDLKIGDKIIIVAKDYSYAMSTEQKTNNRGQYLIKKSDDGTTINYTTGTTTGTQILTLEAGTGENTFAFFTSEGYLYAASKTGNYLKTESTLTANSSWKITITDGVASVVAQGSNTRKVMQYNQTSSLFACYSSASQKAIQIYKLAVAEHTCSGEISYTQKDADCVNAGYLAYYECSCSKLYEDAAATIEIPDLAAWKAEGGNGYIAPLSHKDENSDHICDNGCDVYQGTHADGNDADHLCDYCGKAVDGENCAPTVVPGQAASCGVAGWKDHYACTCGKLYEDAATTKEITDLAAWKAEGGNGYIAPLSHKDENSDHICDNGCDVYQGTHADGNDADHLCDYCQGVVVGENCAAHLTHVPEQYDKCEGGYKEYWTCSCGKYYEDDAATKEITDLSAWKAEGGAGYLKPEHYPSYLIFAETHQLACCVCSARLAAPEPHDYTTGTSAHTCICGDKFTGWEGKVYYENAVMLTGWAEIDGDWYYLDPTTGVRAEGLTRVPYNTALGHDANADDKAYWEANKETSKYTDATTAVYVFGEDGKLNRTTGIVGGNRYAVDGVIAWHVGLVEVEGEYYYFGGDVNGNGNIMMTGKVYVTRNTTDLETVNGGIYTFGEDGKLCKYDGITDIDGTLYYYEDYRLAIEAGLVKFDGDYYYVRSNGQLVVGRDYWVANTNGYLAAGMYTFGADGKIVMGTESEELDGIVDIDGVLYYYKGGVKQVGAGVVKLIDDNGETFYIYVRSNGQLATGIYWPTTRNGYLDRGAYDWGTDGRYYPAED